MSSATARLSAKTPAWKTARRSNKASLDLAIAPHLLGKLERAGIDLAAWPPRELDCMCDGILDTVMAELLAQQIVQRRGGQDLGIVRGRADHQHEFAAGLERVGTRGQFIER